MLCKLWRDLVNKGDLPWNKAVKIDTVHVSTWGIFHTQCTQRFCVWFFACFSSTLKQGEWRIPNDRRDLVSFSSVCLFLLQMSLINIIPPSLITFIHQYQMKGWESVKHRNESDMSSSNAIPISVEEMWHITHFHLLFNKSRLQFLLLHLTFPLSSTHKLSLALFLNRKD